MDRNELILVLAVGTIGLGIVWGLWQFFSVRRSQARRGEAPGAASGTAEMLHHRDRDPQPVDELQPVSVPRPRD